jgi:hypothetical protein
MAGVEIGDFGSPDETPTPEEDDMSSAELPDGDARLKASSGVQRTRSRSGAEAFIYFALVVHNRAYQKCRGVTVFGEPAPAKSCPQCRSEDLPIGAMKCRYCGSSI